jgi:hypothetical protein
MNRNPTPAQVTAAMQAYDEVIGLEQRPNLRQKHTAMVAALRAAADFTKDGGTHERVQRTAAGR